MKLSKKKSIERPVFTAVTYSMCPGVQACAKYCEAHLLHMWHKCSAPACSRMGEQEGRWEEGRKECHGDLEGL